MKMIEKYLLSPAGLSAVQLWQAGGGVGGGIGYFYYLDY